MILRNQRKQFLFSASGFSIPLGQATKIMAIVNVTDDSFSCDGVLNTALSKQVRAIKSFVRQGAAIIDIGAESSRPGAKALSAKTEWQRLKPLLNALQGNIKVPISIDTYKDDVAKACLDQGVGMINTIRGTQLTAAFCKTIARYDAGIVLMHMQGNPSTMQDNVVYTDVIDEIYKKLTQSIEKCLEYGINKDKIIIDPGIGFGKQLNHNLLIIQNLHKFSKLNLPILLGTSRKSFIGSILDVNVNQRLSGSLATVAAGILGGAHIMRVHDVKQSVQTANMVDAIINVKG